MSVPNFSAALDASIKKEKFTPEVQAAAAKVDSSAFSDAIKAVLGGDDTATVEGEQAVALKNAFEFAVAVVKMLKSEPGNEDKLAVSIPPPPPPPPSMDRYLWREGNESEKDEVESIYTNVSVLCVALQVLQARQQPDPCFSWHVRYPGMDFLLFSLRSSA